MANEIVKYHNDLNSISTRNWKAVETDIFFSIIAKAKNNKEKIIELDKDELIRLSNYEGKDNDRFVKILLELVDHVSQLKYKKYEREDNKNKLIVMNLFDQFEFTWSDDFSEVAGKIKVSESFNYILNNFDINFTSFELEQYTKLRSTYSKALYRQLKQYRKRGVRKFTVDEFKYLMAIPKSYKPVDIDRRVINIAMKELKNIFNDLHIKKEKLKKKGSPIAFYVFEWTPEKTNQWIEGHVQPNPNKKKKPKPLPDWYGHTASEEADPQLLEELQALQKQYQK